MDRQQTIAPQIARDNATEMRNIADAIEALLQEVSTKMMTINDGQTGIYDGYKKPSELRMELDRFRQSFHLTHEQIKKSAADIIATANTMENQ